MPPLHKKVRDFLANDESVLRVMKEIGFGWYIKQKDYFGGWFAILREVKPKRNPKEPEIQRCFQYWEEKGPELTARILLDPEGALYFNELPAVKRKLFVGGLNPETSDEVLLNYFNKFGQVTDCEIPIDKKTRSRKFGYVTFSKIETVKEVLEMTHELDDRTLGVKLAASDDKIPKIFIDNLTEDLLAMPTLQEDMKAYFSTFGEVMWIRIVNDRGTRKKGGFAFVMFTDYRPVDRISCQKFHMIHNRRVKVQKAMNDKELKAQKESKQKFKELQLQKQQMNLNKFKNPDGTQKKPGNSRNRRPRTAAQKKELEPSDGMTSGQMPLMDGGENTSRNQDNMGSQSNYSGPRGNSGARGSSGPRGSTGPRGSMGRGQVGKNLASSRGRDQYGARSYGNEYGGANQNQPGSSRGFSGGSAIPTIMTTTTDAGQHRSRASNFDDFADTTSLSTDYQSPNITITVKTENIAPSCGHDQFGTRSYRSEYDREDRYSFGGRFGGDSTSTDYKPHSNSDSLALAPSRGRDQYGERTIANEYDNKDIRQFKSRFDDDDDYTAASTDYKSRTDSRNDDRYRSSNFDAGTTSTDYDPFSPTKDSLAPSRGRDQYGARSYGNEYEDEKERSYGSSSFRGGAAVSTDYKSHSSSRSADNLASSRGRDQYGTVRSYANEYDNENRDSYDSRSGAVGSIPADYKSRSDSRNDDRYRSSNFDAGTTSTDYDPFSPTKDTPAPAPSRGQYGKRNLANEFDNENHSSYGSSSGYGESTSTNDYKTRSSAIDVATLGSYGRFEAGYGTTSIDHNSRSTNRTSDNLAPSRGRDKYGARTTANEYDGANSTYGNSRVDDDASGNYNSRSSTTRDSLAPSRGRDQYGARSYGNEYDNENRDSYDSRFGAVGSIPADYKSRSDSENARSFGNRFGDGGAATSTDYKSHSSTRNADNLAPSRDVYDTYGAAGRNSANEYDNENRDSYDSRFGAVGSITADYKSRTDGSTNRPYGSSYAGGDSSTSTDYKSSTRTSGMNYGYDSNPYMESKSSFGKAESSSSYSNSRSNAAPYGVGSRRTANSSTEQRSNYKRGPSSSGSRSRY